MSDVNERWKVQLVLPGKGLDSMADRGRADHRVCWNVSEIRVSPKRRPLASIPTRNPGASKSTHSAPGESLVAPWNQSGE